VPTAQKGRQGPAHQSSRKSSELSAAGEKHIGGAKNQKAVTKGTWLCQVALLAHWLHRGWLDSTRPSEMLTVLAKPLTEVFAAHPQLIHLVRHYSSCMLQVLAQEHSSNLSDLEIPVEHQSVVAAMPLDARTMLSLGALQVLARKHQWNGHVLQQHGVQELKTEIEAGECDLMVNISEEVLRVVTIVALRLSRCDGKVLTQVGKSTHGVRIGSCQPPGTKVKVGETPQLAVERLVRQKLSALQSNISYGSHSVDTEDRPSRKYGVNSQYFRTLFEGDLSEEDPDSVIVLNRTPEGEADRTSEHEAFVFRDDWVKKASPLFIYAWLTPDEFEYLCGSQGEALLKKWMAELVIDGNGDEEGEAIERDAEDVLSTGGSALASALGKKAPRHPFEDAVEAPSLYKL